MKRKPQLSDAIGRLPLLPAKPTINDLNRARRKAYRLQERPSLELLSSFPLYKGGRAEVGIICIRRQWMLVLGKKGTPGELVLTLPEPFHSLGRKALFSMFGHSHPEDDPNVELPSIVSSDMAGVLGTIDGKSYIITQKGLTEFGKPHDLPGLGGSSESGSFYATWNACNYWIREILKLSEEQAIRRGVLNLWRQFLEEHNDLRSIAWHNRDEVEAILAAKEQLQAA